jgi:hypothetical protein
MNSKAKQGTDVVTVAEVRASLPRARTLAHEEEKALRMRHGVPVAPSAPLARHAKEGTELADELLLIEMQLLRAQRQRTQAQAPARTATTSPTKSKIVRALRKKK